MKYKIFNTYDEAIGYRSTLPDVGSEKFIIDSRRSSAAREESFQRCDTDGFVTQHCHGLSSLKASVEAEVAKHGGTWIFDCLVDVDGNLISTKRFTFPNRFARWEGATKWRVENGAGVKWITDYRREGNYTKLGYRKAFIVAPAKVAYWHPLDKREQPRGFSGLSSIYPLRHIDWDAAGLDK